MKARRSLCNLLVGLCGQLITIALGIVIPRLVLVNLGSEINGLLSSISQIFVYIALLEAGVGAASIQALYKPISKDDREGISSILAATAKYYRKTGKYYFFAVLIFAMIYPFLIDSTLSKIDTMIIILLTGMGGVINYFFQGKYKLLLAAEGKGYINTLISTIISIFTNIVKIILLVWNYNVIIIQASYLIITIVQMLIYQLYISKKYNWLRLNVNPNNDAISQKNSVLIHQISSLIFANTDVFLLTIFCDLKTVSVYVMYNMLFNMVDNLISTLNGSIIFALGQSYHEDKNKYVKLYDAYEVYFMASVFSLFSIAYTLILPFMKLYTSDVIDVNYLNYLIPILFVAIKLLSCARVPSGNVINIAGHFKNTQNRSLLESAINIVFSIVFVNIWGMYGVLIGTIIALLYRSVDMVIYTNRNILNRSPWITAKRWGVDLILFLIITITLKNIKIKLDSYITICFAAVILLIIILPLYFIVASLFDKHVYKFTITYFKKLIINYRKNSGAILGNSNKNSNECFKGCKNGVSYVEK